MPSFDLPIPPAYVRTYPHKAETVLNRQMDVQMACEKTGIWHNPGEMLLGCAWGGSIDGTEMCFVIRLPGPKKLIDHENAHCWQWKHRD